MIIQARKNLRELDIHHNTEVMFMHAIRKSTAQQIVVLMLTLTWQG